jgi:hypothetical protein
VVLYLARGENTDHKDLKGWIWSCIRLPVSGFLTLIVITFGFCNKAEKTRLWTSIIFIGVCVDQCFKDVPNMPGLLLSCNNYYSIVAFKM